MSKKPSGIPYIFTAFVTMGVIVAAWMGRDRIPSVGPGDTAPPITATTLEGEPVSLEDFEGKVVLLNIWATWCAPCVYELPSMEKLSQSLKGEDFEIVAVSVDAREGESDESGRPGGDIRAFADSLGLTFTILHDPEWETYRRYYATGVPESFLIGKDGIIWRKVSGETAWDSPEYLAFIQSLIDEER